MLLKRRPLTEPGCLPTGSRGRGSGHAEHDWQGFAVDDTVSSLRYVVPGSLSGVTIVHGCPSAVNVELTRRVGKAIGKPDVSCQALSLADEPIADLFSLLAKLPPSHLVVVAVGPVYRNSPQGLRLLSTQIVSRTRSRVYFLSTGASPVAAPQRS